MIDLLPCPRCGGPGAVVYDYEMAKHLREHHFGDFPGFWFQGICGSGCMGVAIGKCEKGLSRDEAIRAAGEAWNQLAKAYQGGGRSELIMDEGLKPGLPVSTDSKSGGKAVVVVTPLSQPWVCGGEG